MILYTLGYTGRKIEEIETLLERKNALLVDVRLSPRSRAATWNHGPLLHRLGERYVWARELGNRNYRGTIDQVEIVDLEAGARRLEALGRDRPFVLMCACPDVNQCHRKIVAEFLAARWGAKAVHLGGQIDQGWLF